MAIRVLIVDDDPAFRALARQVMVHGGLDVVGEAGTAGDGADAASALRPDAVLVDVGLPDRDGVSLAGDLAALSWHPRIVLTSTDPDATSTDAARRLGATGFVPKHELPGAGLDLLLHGD
jgi:DNA-binding NarL/FixJ family response regulator